MKVIFSKQPTKGLIVDSSIRVCIGNTVVGNISCKNGGQLQIETNKGRHLVQLILKFGSYRFVVDIDNDTTIDIVYSKTWGTYKMYINGINIPEESTKTTSSQTSNIGSAQYTNKKDTRNNDTQGINKKGICNGFDATYKVGDYIWFNDKDKKFIVPVQRNIGTDGIKEYDYADIFKCEIKEQCKTEEGLFIERNRYTSCLLMDLFIYMKDAQNSIIKINILKSVFGCEKGTVAYTSKLDIAEKIKHMIEMRANSISSKSMEVTDEVVTLLKRYKELLDCGVITEEEFENKKREVLK